MERSFARSTRYSFDRARWRGLCKVTIQEYLIATIQNIKLLIEATKRPVRGIGVKMVTGGALSHLLGSIMTRLITSFTILINRYHIPGLSER